MPAEPSPLYKLGAAYYPDYISNQPTLTRRVSTGQLEALNRNDRLHEDFQRMKKQGIHTIRMGEFSWSTTEPQRGVWQPEIFLRALDLAHEAGIEVIFCTPTATPPKWLIDEQPDILPINRNGQRIPFGSRRHYDFHHPVFKEESRRITEQYARTFGDHPAVTLWQTDNEFGCHNSVFLFTEHARTAFQIWLKKRYNSEIEVLNEEWFTCFWSQHYNSFQEIELPLSSWADQNPHLELDFRRFSNEALCEFQAEQISIIKKHSPNCQVTHNLMTLFTDLCPWSAGRDLDTIGFDHYQMEQDPHPVTSAWQFALMRSIKQKSFLILEQQPIQVNWQPVNRRFSFDWLFLWGMQSAFQGAAGMFYFSWQRMSGGCEQYHDGVVPHDVRIPQSQQEKLILAKNKIFEELKTEFNLDSLPLAQRDVLIIYDSESLWSHEITAQSVHYSTRKQIDIVTEFCLQNALGIWLAPSLESERERLHQYKMIVLPGHAFELTEAELFQLAEFRRCGGIVCSFPRTGYKKRNNQMCPTPAIFTHQDDFYLDDYGAMLEGETENCTMESIFGDMKIEGHLWAEKINLQNKNWKVLAKYAQSSIYAGAPSIIQFPEKTGGAHIHFAMVPTNKPENWDTLRTILNLKYIAKTNASNLQMQTLRLGDRIFLGAVNFSDRSATITLSERVLVGKCHLTALDASLEAVSTVATADESNQLSIAGRSSLFAELTTKRD